MSKGSTWKETTLGTLIDIFDHVRVPLNSRQRAERKGQYPYYGASGIIDSIDGYLFDGSYLLIAEDGENLNSRKLPVAFMATGRFWVNNHAHIIKGKAGIADDYFLLAWFAGANIAGYITGAAQPKLSQANLKNIRLLVPSYPVQRKISAVLSAYDDLIENNARRIAILESMAQALYQEWFVRFRYPGHENVPLVPSSLGHIPQGWSVVRLDAIQAQEPYAIQGGPFGSKLGTKDYVDEGVPVIRGANLSEDGRFRSNEFVFVSEEKSRELRPNQAVPGDIVVTQRGTLGQIGMIPPTTGYDRYIISQSQMKITVDRSKASNEYVLYFLKSPEAIQRIKNMAISSGVPHINLGSLREFEIVLPPKLLQDRFGEIAESIEEGIELHVRRSRVLRRTRDLLLPKLISGQIDVEHLEIDAGADLVGATP